MEANERIYMPVYIDIPNKTEILLLKKMKEINHINSQIC
jgi:hypothetical protein